jgi:hypothetical protein
MAALAAAGRDAAAELASAVLLIDNGDPIYGIIY